jgi:thiamine phosphate synthase YjbQ (UPF0047 family)
MVTESELDRGILIIFVFGSTSAIETIEPRRGLKIEIPFMGVKVHFTKHDIQV